MGVESRARDTRDRAQLSATEAMAEQIRAAIPFSQHQLIDAYGRPIHVGGVYGMSSATPVPGTVVDIRPDLHPNAPPGRYYITLVATVPVTAMSRSPIRTLLWLNDPEGPSEDPGQPGATTPSPLEPTPPLPSGIIITG